MAVARVRPVYDDDKDNDDEDDKKDNDGDDAADEEHPYDQALELNHFGPCCY